jgi:STE24 endopeptidase
MVVELFTEAELTTARTYHDPQYLVSGVQLLLAPFSLAAIAAFLTRPLYALSVRLTARWRSALLSRMWRSDAWAASLVFALLFVFAYELVGLPLSYWSDFVVEHRYGLSKLTFSTYVLDALKGYAVLAVAVSALAFGLFGLARRLPGWWVALSVVGSLTMAGSTLLDPYTDRLYVEQTPLAPGPLHDRITETMHRAGIDFSAVQVDQTAERSVRMNAAFAGVGPTRTIMVNDTLLTNLTDDEVIAAISHEAGHVGQPKWPARVMAMVAFSFFLFAVEWLFRRSAARGWFGISARADIRTLPLIYLCFTLLGLVGTPLSAAVQRKAERDADAYAITLTHDPAAFRSMLVKLARVNWLDPDPPLWVELMQGHPPIAQRIEAAR